MKVITFHQRVNPNELFDLIQKQLNPLFKEQRKTDLQFNVARSGNIIEITQPELYPGDVLYKIEIDRANLNITRSEHYVDDVNSLTIESILNDLFNGLSRNQGTDLVQEG